MKNFNIPYITNNTVKNIIKDDKGLTITFECGMKAVFRHIQECCEKVWLEDINGDLCDFEGQILTEAYYSESHEKSEQIWTFIHLKCPKGTLVLRWISNTDTAYSIGVDVVVTNKEPKYDEINLSPSVVILKRNNRNQSGWSKKPKYIIAGIELKRKDDILFYGKKEENDANVSDWQKSTYLENINIILQIDKNLNIIPHSGYIILYGVQYIVGQQGKLIENSTKSNATIH